MTHPLRPRLVLVLSTLVAVSIAAAPGPTSEPEITKPPSVLGRYYFGSADTRKRLPKYLREISGLARGSGQHVFLHHDNSALVWRFDISENKLNDTPVQAAPAKGDFEGTARVGDQLLLSSSHATLRVVTNNQLNDSWIELPFTGLCNFEGLAAIDEESSVTLLLPCKYPRFEEAGAPAAKDNRLYIFRHALTPTLEVANTPMARLEIDVSPVLKAYRLPRLRPSAVEVVDNRLLILAGKERVIIETNLEGSLIAWRRLSWPRHRQAEGLTLLSDGTLVIADEGRWLGGTITSYTAL